MNEQTTPEDMVVKPPVTPQSLVPVFEALDSGLDIDRLLRGITFREAGLDSLDIFNLVLAVENAAGIKIPDEDLGPLQDLPSLASYLDRRLS
jgi:acyl carrier protein